MRVYGIVYSTIELDGSIKENKLFSDNKSQIDFIVRAVQSYSGYYELFEGELSQVERLV